MPFIYTEIHEERQTLCCPYWNTTNIKESEDLLANWHSDKAEEIRNSMLDGTWKNCTEFCPHFDELLKTGKSTNPHIKSIEKFDRSKYNKPKRVKFCFDNACNLKCPSCRSMLIPNTDIRTIKSKKFFKNIEKGFADELEEIFTSGTGDPFYSKPTREYLQSITKHQYPKLSSVILHTNAILWTPKVWNMMSNIHEYVTQCEISIDAASKESYEKIRVNGKWETLINNLHFINSIENLKLVNLSFVAQRDNFTEMEDFVLLMKDIFKSKNHNIIFYKIADWGVIPQEQYKKLKIWDEAHSDYKLFREEVKKLEKYDNITYNFH